MRNTRSCNYFHDHHASDNNWSRPIIITRTRNTETHVKQKFFNFKNTQLLRHYYFLLAHCASVTFARSLSTRLLSRHFENSSFLSTWRSCALNARISKQSISTIYICWKFFNKRATDLRERVAHFFFFFFLFSRKKEEKRISTNFDRSRWTTTNFALFGLRICNHLNYSKRDVVATQKLDAFRSIHRAFVAGFVSKKKGKKKERGTKEDRTASDRFRRCNAVMN